MTFNTRNVPRLGQTSPALTSLGAVGGARGVSAGALRIFVEFLTTYDRSAIQQLESDLANTDHAANNSAIAERKRLTRLHSIRTRLNDIERVTTGKLNSALRTDLKEILALQGSRSKTDKTLLANKQREFTALSRSLGVSEKEVGLLFQRTELRKKESIEIERQAKGEATQTRLGKQRLQQEGAISKIQSIRAGLGPKLAGLAIGAVGGIFGGAVLGVGFQLAQTGLEKLGDVVQNLLDPARQARAAMEDLAKAVNDVASADKISQLQAAAKIVAQFGATGTEAARLAGALAEVAVLQAVKEGLEQRGKATDVANNLDKLRAEILKLITERTRDAAKAEGTYRSERVASGKAYPQATTKLLEYVGALRIEEVALGQLNTLLGINTDQSLRAEQATQRLAAANQLAAFAQDKFANALRSFISTRQASAETQIEGLSTEPSSRTAALEAALERAQGGGSSNAASLRANAEERSLILLRQRLKLLGTNINLEKFSGKFLLEAINVKISAIQKEGDEQDRLNKLLDLQFESSKAIRRQTGESIADFVERRAQEQRAQLAAARDAEREALISSLEAQQDKVQDEVDLVENAEQRKQIAAQGGANKRTKLLQKQLEESRKADRKALEDQKKLIRDKAAADVAAANEAIRVSQDKYREEFRIAITAVKNIEDLFKLSAEVQGLNTAQGFLRGFGPTLVAAGALTQQELNRMLSNLSASLSGFANKRNQIITGRPSGRGKLEFQHGGVMMLNNSRSPFGQNVKLGEGGTELGIILSNKVAAALKDRGSGVDQVGPFNLYGSVDPLRDTYRFKRLVKEAVSEALR